MHKISPLRSCAFFPPAPYRFLFGLLAFSLILALTVLPAAAGPLLFWELQNTDRYMFRQDDSKGRWKNWRRERQERKEAQGKEKELTLKEISFPEKQGEGEKSDRWDSETVIWVQPPSGVPYEMVPASKEGNLTVSVPPDLDLNGRYMILSRTMAKGKLFLCAKTFVAHMKKGGRREQKAGAFLDNPEKFPLEIGPVLPPRTNPYEGVMQTEHMGQSFQVRFCGRPLSGAPLRVMTESGWIREYRTGKEGTCVVTPIEDRSDQNSWQRYLYVTEHEDKTTGYRYISTFTTIVCDYRHKWRSMLLGVTVLSVLTVGLTACTAIAIFFYRRKKRCSMPVVLLNRSDVREKGDR